MTTDGAMVELFGGPLDGSTRHVIGYQNGHTICIPHTDGSYDSYLCDRQHRAQWQGQVPADVEDECE